MRRTLFLLLLLLSMMPGNGVGAQGPSEVQMLAPGFKVQELPVKLSNINNLRFAGDGRLFALGYDGRIHVLRDTDKDGLEDEAKFFWKTNTLSVPVGIALADEGVYVASHGKVSLLRDTDGDGVGDREEIVASGWLPTDVASGGVDAAALTLDGKGNLYFGLLTADYSNPYRVKDGVSHYDLAGKRGTIQKLKRGEKESRTIATGIRVTYALAFNRAGDLFCTDQEGETWCPNGNPLDELNHIIEGRNYGFPPQHEKWLPNLESVAPVVGFGPQHQSACGMVFNEPRKGQGLFGPKWWQGDAFVAGESRSKIWRVRLVKTAKGYVGKEFTIARLSMLATDVAISPDGALYVSCHSGEPDWGTGPKGQGKLFKITYEDSKAPQPVMAWASESDEVRVAFDKPVDASVTNDVRGQQIDFGENARAGDRFEVLKPPYKVVERQKNTPRGKLNTVAARMLDRHTLSLTTDPHPQPVTYALTIPGVKAAGKAGPGETVDVDYDLSETLSTSDQVEIVRDLPRGRKIVSAWKSKKFAFAGVERKTYPYIHPPEQEQTVQYASGDFERGLSLFFGEHLKCSTCHRIRGEGGTNGPDLSNLVSREAASVLRDLKEPNASIHPDYVAYNLSLTNGEVMNGFVRAQDNQWLRLIGADGKEVKVHRTEARDLKPSAVSLMPAGLLDPLKPSQVEDLLTYLLNAPPERNPAEVKRALAAKGSTGFSKPVRIVLVASKQDHDKGQHDYPRWQKDWRALLARGTNLTVEDAWLWPTPEQFQQADALVFYYWNRDWNAEKFAQLDQFFQQGKGIVLLHSSTIGNPMVEELAQRIGLAADSEKTKYIHAPAGLRIVAATNHAIFRGLPGEIHFLDEPYWPMIGDTNKVNVLATTERDGAQWPIMWTFQPEKGRVFASIFGHYTWTLNDPWFRLIILRAIAWAAGEEEAALEGLVFTEKEQTLNR